MNVLFSTTRQWNPGDEFILLGCIRALQSCGLTFNPIIYNRNPQIRTSRRLANHLDLHQLRPAWSEDAFKDNSFKDTMDLDWVDLAVFAGSPEWRGRRLTPLYRKLVQSPGRPQTMFLGLGSARPFAFDNKHFSRAEMQVLNRAKLITCRDAGTASSLAPLPVHQITCPAMLSSPFERIREKVSRIGLMYGHPAAAKNNNISHETYRYLTQLYRRIIEVYGPESVEFVTHYIDEMPLIQGDFPEATVHYSYDAKDYLAIYDRFDLVIGHRVHGVGISASMGIPGMCLVHDRRGETAKGFGAELFNVTTPMDQVLHTLQYMATNLSSTSEALIHSKRQLSNKYQQLIQAALQL